MKTRMVGAICATLLLAGCGTGSGPLPVVRNATTLRKISRLPMLVYLPTLAGYACPIRYQPPVRIKPDNASGSSAPRYAPWQVTIFCTRPQQQDMVMITEYPSGLTKLGKQVELGGSLWETSNDGPSYVMTLFGPTFSMEIGGKSVKSRLTVVLIGTPSESLAFLERFAASLKRRSI
jgi:hypothetical protein